jgi:hypothetical protein
VAKAGADIRCAVLLAALSLARCRARVAAASLGLPKELAESGERKEDNESKASDWRFVALVLKVRAEGELGHVGLESGRFEVHNGKFGLYLAHGTPDSQAQKSSHGVGPGHLLQD